MLISVFLWCIVCCNSVYLFYLSGYTYLGDGDTDRREILHDGRYGSPTQSFPLCGIPSRGPKIPNFDREYLENGESQRYMSTVLEKRTDIHVNVQVLQ